MKWYKYILNKMVHLKYPILEIWCCHKHTNQLLPSGLKSDTKLIKESVPKQSGSIALHKSFSQAKYSTQFCTCLFVLANQIRIQASKTQIFGYLWHLLLFSNAFFNTQMWQKAEEYICPQVGLSSTAQAII